MFPVRLSFARDATKTKLTVSSSFPYPFWNRALCRTFVYLTYRFSFLNCHCCYNIMLTFHEFFQTECSCIDCVVWIDFPSNGAATIFIGSHHEEWFSRWRAAIRARVYIQLLIWGTRARDWSSNWDLLPVNTRVTGKRDRKRHSRAPPLPLLGEVVNLDVHTLFFLSPRATFLDSLKSRAPWNSNSLAQRACDGPRQWAIRI